MQDKLDYAMRYFELHANQRMSTFNFFIVLNALLITALVSTFDKDFIYPGIGHMISISIVYVSIIFWKLDQRVRFLIKHAEKSLSLIEENEKIADSLFPDLFSSEIIKTKELQKGAWKSVFKLHMFYSQCFGAIYFLFGLIGVFGIIARIVLG